jgi:hypothetical protein
MSVEKMADKYRVPSVRYMRYRTDGTRYEGYYSFLPTFNPDGVIAIVGVALLYGPSAELVSAFHHAGQHEWQPSN